MAREKTKIFGPEWSNAYGKKLENLIGINCETAVEICKIYNIKSYPDIRVFHQDMLVATYKGPLRAAAYVIQTMLSWLEYSRINRCP